MKVEEAKRWPLSGDILLPEKSPFRPPHIEEEETTGSGLATRDVQTHRCRKKQGGKVIAESPVIQDNLCPNNILADVDRLKILIGRRRANKNSREVINEADAICQHLFTGGVMETAFIGN